MHKTYLGAILLIVGTSIGAGMLALPIGTAQLGFLPATALFITVWYVMYLAALLTLEISLRLEPGTNIVSMASFTLGGYGKIFAWTIYLLLLYSLNVAYLSAISDIIQVFARSFFQIVLHRYVAVLLLISFFTAILYLGTKAIDRINKIMVFGMSVTFLILLYFFYAGANFSWLLNYDSHGFDMAIPIITTSFGFHIIIPSLRNYLRSDVAELKRVIFIGSLIPLIIYIVWLAMVFSVIPRLGPNGLLSIWYKGGAENLLDTLSYAIGGGVFPIVTKIFSFFIIATSFIGVSLSLFDFLADGFSTNKTHLGRLSTAALTFLPPLCFVLADAKIFFSVLSYAGVFVALLLCLLPVAMNAAIRRSDRPGKLYMVNSLQMVLVSFFAFVVLFAAMLT